MLIQFIFNDDKITVVSYFYSNFFVNAALFFFYEISNE